MSSLLCRDHLERYYDLAGADVAPAPPPSRERSYTWLAPLLESAAAIPGELCALDLDVQGVHCAACVWLMEELFRRHDGGARLLVNPALGSVRLVFRRGRFDVQAFVVEVERFGYRFGARRKLRDRAGARLALRIGVCAALTIQVMLFSFSFYVGLSPREGDVFVLFTWLSAALSLVVFLVGGSVFINGAWQGLRRGVLHLDLPIAAGIVLAFGASLAQLPHGRGDRAYFDTINVFVTLMLVGRWLQQRVLEGNRRYLLDDTGADALVVRRREGERLTTIAAARVECGDVLVLAPGDLVPVESTLLESAARWSNAWITGEPADRVYAVGETVLAGACNTGTNAATVCARTAFADSPLPALLRAPASDSRVSAQARFISRLARVYVVVVLALACVAFFAWRHVDPSRAIDVTVALLVVTCPCALGIAGPLAYEIVQARLRRLGLYVRRADFLDRLPDVRKLLFDKTGTLTLERLDLVHPAALDALTPALRDALYDMTARSRHPVSRCIARALEHGSARFSSHAEVREEPGRGLEMVREGRVHRLGAPAWALGDAALTGPTVLAVDGQVALWLPTRESVRPDARRELDRLTNEGYAVWLISGDATPRVQATARLLGIRPDHALGDQSPDDKAAVVARLDAGDTLYFGDGINDSLAFERAFVSGTPAIDRAVLPGKADFFLLGEAAAPIGVALLLARRLQRVLRRNLAFALTYNVFAVAACLAGVVTPLRAAVAMPASSLFILLLTAHSLGKATP